MPGDFARHVFICAAPTANRGTFLVCRSGSTRRSRQRSPCGKEKIFSHLASANPASSRPPHGCVMSGPCGACEQPDSPAIPPHLPRSTLRSPFEIFVPFVVNDLSLRHSASQKSPYQSNLRISTPSPFCAHFFSFFDPKIARHAPKTAIKMPSARFARGKKRAPSVYLLWRPGVRNPSRIPPRRLRATTPPPAPNAKRPGRRAGQSPALSKPNTRKLRNRVKIRAWS